VVLAKGFPTMHEKSRTLGSGTLIDTGDGSGDAYVEIPFEILMERGWPVGQIFDIDVQEDVIVLTPQKLIGFGQRQ
jgi:hypothetical protein